MVTNGLWNAFDWSVLEDPGGKLWVGSWGSGLFFREGGEFLQPPGVNYNAAIPAIYRSRDGALWLGTPEGLGRYSNGVCMWYTRTNGLAVPDVRTITEDSTGTIWFGMSGGGLGELKDGKVRQYRKSPGGLPSDFVWSLLATDDDTLWIGTFGGGICRMKDGKFSTVSTAQGLPNNVICHIANGHQGEYWVSSYGGIFRVSKSDLNACADGRANSVYCFTYGKADGLATLECSGGFQPSGCQTADGRLWFPTSRGLAVVDPAKVTVNPVPPPVVIEDVTVDDKLMPIADVNRDAGAPVLTIPAGRERFEFRYAGLSFVAPEKVRFKYRLDGLEKDWVEAGTRRVAYYSFLKPGPYTFRVAACNNDGVWNESGAAISIVVRPHFWQTWWFSCLAMLAGAGIVGGAARAATRRRLRDRMEKLERQQALERERARIAQDIHDDLGASLTRIIFLSQSAHGEMDDHSPAASDLDQIYFTARELTRAMDEIVWAVSPQHDTLDSLVTYLGKFAQDYLSVAGIRCRLDVPIALPAWPLTSEVRHNLFLAFKEALHNVVKHAAATEVRVSLIPADTGFSLSVSDNGKGFDPARAVPSAAPNLPPGGRLRYSGGNGLVNMKRRLEEIGGLCEFKSSPGEGTHIKFVVNVKVEA
jgi:signal transduction histidine kinase